MRIAKSDTGPVTRAVASLDYTTGDSAGMWTAAGAIAFLNAIIGSTMIADGGSLWILMGWALLIPFVIYAIILFSRTDRSYHLNSYRIRALNNYVLIPKNSFQKPIARPLIKQIELHAYNDHPGVIRVGSILVCEYCKKREEAIENLVPDHLTSDDALIEAQDWIKHRKELMS